MHRNWSLGHYTPPRLPQPADLPNQWLEENARNLGLVLNRLKRKLETKNNPYLNSLHLWSFPHFVSVRFPAEIRKITLSVNHKEPTEHQQCSPTEKPNTGVVICGLNTVGMEGWLAFKCSSEKW